MSKNQYNLKVNEIQLKLINTALEEYFRIRMGQMRELADDFAELNLNLDPTLENHEKIFDTFINRRDAVYEILRCAFQVGVDGIPTRKTEDMLVAEDIWQVIRHELWKAAYRQDPEHTSTFSVWSREPVQWSEQPLAVCTLIEE